MRRKRKKILKSKNLSFSIRILLAALFIGGFILLIKNYDLKNKIKNIKSVIETPRSEVHKLPDEIKNKIVLGITTKNYRIPIFLYHYVEYVKDTGDIIRKSLNITPDVFEEQLKTLKDANYTFLTAKDVGEILDKKREMPARPILLTFDDGHWDFYTDILPLLDKYQAKATLYVIPGFLGGSDFLDEGQLKIIAMDPLVEIGAHTMHHASLKFEPYDVLQYEIRESKVSLEKMLNREILSFAYPNGAFDELTLKVIKENKFTTAMSTIPGIDQNLSNRLFLNRLRPGGRTGQELLSWLQKSTFVAY